MSIKIDKTAPLNILIIEDNSGDYFLIEEYLQETTDNLLINHCENFENAIEFIEENKKSISIIFSDLNLPDASEIELVKNLLEYSAPIPVILLSGYESEKIMEESKKIGAFDFLLKNDLNPNLLKKTIEIVIQKMAK